jgi:predicted small secreted protein
MHKVMMLLAVAAVLAGCNTVAGVGEDVKEAGKGIQRAVK